MIEKHVKPAPRWEAQAPIALLVAAPARMAANAEEVAASGARLVAQVTPEAAGARIAQQIALDLILFDATGIAPDLATETAANLAEWASERGCRVVAVLPNEALDTVASPLLTSGATLLCGATPAEHAAALITALPQSSARLHDASREREVERLRLLNEEVARLAQMLSQLAAEPPAFDTAGGVREAGSSFHAEGPSEPDPDPRVVRTAIRARRLREQMFSPELFADPAWDMLLDLYAARLERRRVSVSSLCIAAAVPRCGALTLS